MADLDFDALDDVEAAIEKVVSKPARYWYDEGYEGTCEPSTDDAEHEDRSDAASDVPVVVERAEQIHESSFRDDSLDAISPEDVVDQGYKERPIETRVWNKLTGRFEAASAYAAQNARVCAVEEPEDVAPSLEELLAQIDAAEAAPPADVACAREAPAAEERPTVDIRVSKSVRTQTFMLEQRSWSSGLYASQSSEPSVAVAHKNFQLVNRDQSASAGTPVPTYKLRIVKVARAKALAMRQRALAKQASQGQQSLPWKAAGGLQGGQLPVRLPGTRQMPSLLGYGFVPCSPFMSAEFLQSFLPPSAVVPKPARGTVSSALAVRKAVSQVSEAPRPESEFCSGLASGFFVAGKRKAKPHRRVESVAAAATVPLDKLLQQLDTEGTVRRAID